MSDIAVSVQNLTKTYRIFGHPGDRIKQALTFGRRRFHREFTALKDVSLHIRKGETVGIIGRNGSGKSTLLQLICGILKPTSGTVSVNGRISALLELGAGFNPEFTGRENVFFQGVLMGLSETQMKEKFDEISAFADIGAFIDQPVRTYSSGMFVRLAFSVAIHVDPEILIIDEALGVGDSEFQDRSISRMKSMRENGVTILLVSHSLPAIRNFCERVVWLDGGGVLQEGNAGKICQAYQQEIGRLLHSGDGRSFRGKGVPAESESNVVGRGKSITIESVVMENPRVVVGGPVMLHFDFSMSAESEGHIRFGLGVIIHNDEGRIVGVLNTVRDDLILGGDCRKLCLRLPRISLVPGRYWVSVDVCDSLAMYSFDRLDHCLSFEVLDELNRQGIPRWEGEVACEHVWCY